MEIKELPQEVRNHLRSGFQMTNVVQCVNELVFNSLDAKSTKIAVRINMKIFRIQIVDNGDGITKNNLDLLTKRYMTNKCHTVDDYKRNTTYGYKGESLSSIRNNSKKITVSTRCPPDESTYTKIFEGDIANDIIVAKHRPSQGTTITVEGFLYNLPVRQKSMDCDVELINVKKNLELLAIIQPSVSFSLRNEERKLMMLVTNTADTVERALITAYPEVDQRHLFSTRVKSCENIKISALVSARRLQGTKVQLLYVNKRPVNCSRLHNFIDDIFQGTIDSGVGYFVYIVNIKCPYSNVNVAPSSFSKYTVEFKNWTVVFKYIEKMLKKFLQSHNLMSTNTVTTKAKIEEKNILGNIDGACQAKATKRKLDTSLTEQKNVPDIPDKVIKLSEIKNKNRRSNNKLKVNADKYHKELRKPKAKKNTNGPRTKARVSGISKATVGVDNNKIESNIGNYLLKRSSALRATAIKHETCQENDNQSQCNFKQVLLNSRKSHFQQKFTALRATPPCKDTRQQLIIQSLANLGQIGMKNNVTCCTSSSKLVRFYTKKMLMLEDVDNQNIGKAIIMDKFLKSSDRQWNTQGEQYDRKTAISVSVKIKRRSENSKRNNVSVFNFECQTNLFESFFHHNKFSNKDMFDITIPRNRQLSFLDGEDSYIYENNDFAVNDKNILFSKKNPEPIFSKIFENISTFARTRFSKIAGKDKSEDKAYFEFLQPSNSVGIFGNVQHRMENFKTINHQEPTLTERDISYLSQMNNFRNYVQSTQVLNNSLINVEVKQNVTIMKDRSVFYAECNKSRFSINYCDNNVNKMEDIRKWVKNCEAYNSMIQQTYTSHAYEDYFKNDNKKCLANETNCFRRRPPIAVVDVLEDVVIRPNKQGYEENFLLQNRQKKYNSVQKKILQNTSCSINKPLPFENIFKKPLAPSRVKTVKSILAKNHKDKIRMRIKNTDTFSRDELIHKGGNKLLNNNNTEGFEPFKFPLHSNEVRIKQTPPRVESKKSILKKNHKDKIRIGMINCDTFFTNKRIDNAGRKFNNNDSTEGFKEFKFPPLHLNKNSKQLFNAPKKCLNVKTTTPFTKKYEQIKQINGEDQCDVFKFQFNPTTLNSNNEYMFSDLTMHRRNFEELPDSKNDYKIDCFHLNKQRSSHYNFRKYAFPIDKSSKNLRKNKCIAKGMDIKKKSSKPFQLFSDLLVERPVDNLNISVRKDFPVKYETLMDVSNNIDCQNNGPIFEKLHKPDFAKPFSNLYHLNIDQTSVDNIPQKVRYLYKENSRMDKLANYPSKVPQIALNRNLIEKQPQFETMASPKLSVNKDCIKNHDSDLINPVSRTKYQETFKDDDLFISLNDAQVSFNGPCNDYDDIFFQESKIVDTNGKNKKKKISDLIPVTSSGCSNSKIRTQNITNDIFISPTESIDNIDIKIDNLNKNVEGNISDSSIINTNFAAVPNLSMCKNNFTPSTENQALRQVQNYNMPETPPGVWEFTDLDKHDEKKQNKFIKTKRLVSCSTPEIKSTKNKMYKNQSFRVSNNISDDNNRDKVHYSNSPKKVLKTKRDGIKDHSSQFSKQKSCRNKKKKKEAILQKWRNDKHSTITDKVVKVSKEKHTFTAKEESETIVKHTSSKQRSADNTSLNNVEQIGGEVVKETTKCSPNEWIEQYNTSGDKIFVNFRTGMIRTSSPNEKIFNMKSRISFVPKGLSPILSSKQVVHSSITASTKEKLYEAIEAAYEKELGVIKWQNIVKNQDLKSYFDAVFSKLSRKTAVITDVSKKVQQRIIAKSHEGLHSYNFSKEIFKDVTVVGQMDNKFIVGLLEEKSLLLLFDQHAVHERIRVEKLTKEYTIQNALGSKMYKCQSIDYDLQLQLSKQQIEILVEYKHRFRKLGLSYRLNKDWVEIVGVPYCFSKKGCNDKKMEKLKNLVISLIEEEIDNIQMIKGVPSNIPRTIQNVINSEACRGAIMFGDKLSIQHCKKLLRKLTDCKLPFQCAHGRPTITPLIQLKALDYKVPCPHLERLKNKNKI